ncbi:MAG: PDDEXK nuclease domain-containing protein [bacterium]|nr:DUF1016 family protein [bacterium]MBU1918740.1 DUF1016 family protein [bacterium]
MVRKTKKSNLLAKPNKALLKDIKSFICEAKLKTSQVINVGLAMLYWNIGNRILKDIKKSKRADYGQQIVGALARQLTSEFGKGFTKDNLFRMIQFVERFPSIKIVGALSRQLTWTHFVQMLPIEDPLKREFYTEMCRIEGWSTRTLEKKIGGMLFERTALSKKPDKLIKLELKALREKDKLTPDLVFRDPYFLDFLGLKDTFLEKDVESAILRDLESFILEIGIGFTFVERQKRITVDNEDYYLDLLFYHRKLKRLVAIELKLGKFKAADKGQMELYLRWLEEYEKEKGEEPPIGLILCADKSEEHVKLLQLGKSGIRVASYLTDLPPRKLLQEKLHQSMLSAKKRFAK